MTQNLPPLEKIIQALEHTSPDIRKKGINALVRTSEVDVDAITETLQEISEADDNADVRQLAELRLKQYRQYIQKKQPNPTVTITPPTTSFISSEKVEPGLPTRMSKDVFVLNLRTLPFLFGDEKKATLEGQWKAVLTSGFGLFSGLLLLILAIYLLQDYLDWQKIPVSGAIIDIQFNQQFEQVAVYEFTAPNGSKQRGTYTIEGFTSTYYPRIGDTVKIEYVNGQATMIPPVPVGRRTALTFASAITISVGSLIALIFATLKMDKLQALRDKGQVIDGLIISAELIREEGRTRSYGLGIIGLAFSFIWSRFINPRFIMHIEYQFQSPESKKVVAGHGKCVRNDLVNKRLPAMSTPVKVLYLNDKNHVIL